MAKKISQLPLAPSLNATDEIEINQNGESKKIKISDLGSFFSLGNKDIYETTIAGGTVTLPWTPTFVWGAYMEGQELQIGGRITSIIGNVVTFDSPTDYIGLYFKIVAQY